MLLLAWPLSDQTIGTLHLLVTITLQKNEETYPTTFHGKFGNSSGPNYPWANLPESPPMVLRYPPAQLLLPLSIQGQRHGPSKEKLLQVKKWDTTAEILKFSFKKSPPPPSSRSKFREIQRGGGQLVHQTGCECFGRGINSACLNRNSQPAARISSRLPHRDHLGLYMANLY